MREGKFYYFRSYAFFIISLFLFILCLNFISAGNYTADIYFNLPDSVFSVNETVSLKGMLYQINLSSSSNASAIVANATVNLTIRNSEGVYASSYSFTTDNSGFFYSKSNYYPSATQILTPNTAGTYYIKAEYIDPENSIWYSQIEITVVNKTLDILEVSSDKAIYNPSEAMIIEAEAIKKIGDKIIYISNVSISGSVRDSSETIISSFSCTTGNNGKCTASLNAPATYGDYVIELNNFKSIGSFSVVPFSYSLYMNDELDSLKNVFALGEKASVKVIISNASGSDSYSFSGSIKDSSGNSIKTISATTLNSNNSFSNSYQFTIDAITFSYGTYNAYITVTKSGDGSISSTSSFQVQDWMLAVEKKSSSSGFEYEYSAFPNKTLRFEALPTYRSNGSVIVNITNSSFNVSLKDSLNNVIDSTTAVWNASCGKSGCYEFSISSPLNIGQYIIYTSLSYSGDTQIDSKLVNVVSGIMSGQSTDKDGNIKELFGTSDYIYISLSAYNQTSSSFNISDAEIFLVTYMNGSEISYISVNYSLVNSSNSINEWAWNSSTQKIKLDVPKIGGLYNIFVFGNNRTMGAEARFIVNPYASCVVSKNSASNSGNSYTWQFKTTDTIYFEIQLTQANNPLGKATSLNRTGNSSSYGMFGGGCNMDTTTKQVVTNASLSILEVKNLESGANQDLNTSLSSCQASDSSGKYLCIVAPYSKWDGGQNIVEFNVQGQDGTISTFYGNFESRAFYLYGYSQTWQNNPSSDINLSLWMYEVGSGSNNYQLGTGGTITVKRVEYQGRDGEWIWPPVDSGYNVSNLSTTRINATSSWNSNILTLPASYASGGVWKTGNYRVVLQATTDSEDTDYGYAWFGVKLWEVYGQPIECISSSCNYKNYFNSKENISLYITINKAGNNWWSSNMGGQNIYGNVSVGIKKIQDCRTWPCKELNSSQYSASKINVNASSPGYWYASSNQSSYIIQINSTTGTWGTGYYSVTLDINGTDTGYAWFNTIAFYVETQPTDINGTNYKYNIRGNQAMYFNITTTKSYKSFSSYWNGSTYVNSRYNASDYINATINDAVLRTWDQQNYRSKELNYPEDINITIVNKTNLVVTGDSLVNLTYLNGSWPTGYYWGELTLKNSDNETSTGWLWFNVQPFRVSLSTVSNSYSGIDSDQCVNTSLDIYEPDWTWPYVYLNGNYSITSIYEDIWGWGGSSRITYSNYTSSSFNASAYVNICPNNASWGSGSWGGYHYLSVVVKDNIYNDTQSGWLSFRTVPFSVSWTNDASSRRTNENLNVSASLTKPSTGASALGRLTKIYQWRYDTSQSTKEEYVFRVGNSSTGYCYSNVSSYCNINGTQSVLIYVPSGGWKVGYNYLYAEWTTSDGLTKIEDWNGIYFDGRSAYSGWFDTWWSEGGNYYSKYYLAVDENITLKLNIQDTNYQNSDVNITSVEYAYSGDNCWSDWCRTYTAAEFSPRNTSNGIAIIRIKTPPSTNWLKGYYSIRASVSGSGGTATITGGQVRVKDFVAPNITSVSISNNATYSRSISFSATTSENAQCYLYLISYDNFYSWYCGNWNVVNSSNSSSNTAALLEGACNYTKYNYAGSSYIYDYISNSYHSYHDGTNYSYCYTSPGSSSYCYGSDNSKVSTYLTTGTTTHTYDWNITSVPNQHYGLYIGCNDDDYNYGSKLMAFKINNSL